MAVMENWTQTSFRYRDDDDSESAATWRKAVNTDDTLSLDTNYRMRFLITGTHTSGSGSFDFTCGFQYRVDAGTWTTIDGSSSNVRVSTSSEFTDDDATTEQMSGGATFVAGHMDDSGACTAVSVSEVQETEFELCFQLRSAELSGGEAVEIRCVNSGTALELYTATPSITAASSGVDATGISTLAAFSQAATGTVDVAAAGTSTLAAFSQEAAGSVDVAATGTSTLAAFSQAGTGSVPFPLNAERMSWLNVFTSPIVIPLFPADGTIAEGDREHLLNLYAGTLTGGPTATGTSTLAAFSQEATGTVDVAATGTSTLAAFSQVATAAVLVQAAGTSTLAAFSQSATATVDVAAVGTSTLAAFSQEATAAATATATGTSTLAAFSQAGTSTVDVVATGISTLAAFSQAGAGTLGGVQATGTSTLAAFSQVGTATVDIAATGSSTLAAFSQAATTTVDVAATGTSTLAAFSQEATASAPPDGRTLTGVSTLAAFSQEAAATVDIAAAGTSTLAAFSQVATATVDIAAVGTSTLAAFSQVGTVSLAGVEATGTSTLAAFGQVATATVDVVVTGTSTLAAFSQVSTGSIPISATGTSTLPGFSQFAEVWLIPQTHVGGSISVAPRVGGILESTSRVGGSYGVTPRVGGILEVNGVSSNTDTFYLYVGESNVLRWRDMVDALDDTDIEDASPTVSVTHSSGDPVIAASVALSTRVDNDYRGVLTKTDADDMVDENFYDMTWSDTGYGAERTIRVQALDHGKHGPIFH